ncbi:MAG TPA: CAP domain-containing protein [Gaiellaceae bacterium]|nr:CAP domain-containing protein [Gaiellaceae bacterium]
MLKRLTALGAAILVLICTTTTAVAGLTRGEARLIRDLNRVRAAHGLTPLRYDPHLQRAALAHSHDMLASQLFQHGAFGARMVQFEVRGSLTGENLAWGNGPLGSASSIVRAWLASPEHRANLLRPAFTRIGIGDLVGPFLGYDGAHVVTADFAG